MFKINSLANRVTDLNHRQFPQYERLQALQVGDYKLSVRSSDVNGWLVCDGRSLSRAEYPELFDIIGTDFGSANVNSFKALSWTDNASNGITNMNEHGDKSSGYIATTTAHI